MVQRRSVTVACVLSAEPALSRVTTGIQELGGRALTLTAAALLGASPASGIDALVYDLEPGDASAAELVRRARSARPDWPVWLYYAPRALVTERAAEVASLRSVWATPQGTDPRHEAEVHVHLRRLLNSVPRVRLLQILGPILRALPPEVQAFLQIGLERGERRFTVRDGAGLDAGHLRRLERVCHAAEIRGPKHLVDCLLLTFLAYKTFAFEMPPSSAAVEAGVSPRALRGLRKRVLGVEAGWAALAPGSQFEFALMALADACNVPRWAAEEIVREAVRGQSA